MRNALRDFRKFLTTTSTGWLPRRELLRRYGDLARWLLADSAWRFKSSIVWILITGFLSVTVQVWAIGTVVYYARLLESGKPYRLLGFTFLPRSSPALLGVVAVTVLVSILLASLLIFYSQTKTISLARQYQDFCAERVLRLSAAGFGAWMPELNQPASDTLLLKIARSDGRFLGRGLMTIIGGFVPTLTAIVGLGALFLLNLPVTLLLVSIIAFSVLFHFRISVIGARHSKVTEDHTAAASAELRQVLRWHRDVAHPTPGPPWWQVRVLQEGRYRRYMDGYEGRLQAMTQSQMVSNVTFGVVLCILVALLGGEVLWSQQGWGRLLGYVVALRYSFSALTDVSRRLIGVNRFYPQFRRYASFLKLAQAKAEAVPPPDSLRMRIDRAEGALPETLREWQSPKAGRVAILSPFDLDKASIAWVLSALVEEESDQAQAALGAVWFLSSRLSPPPSDRSGTLHLEDLGSIPDLESWLAEVLEAETLQRLLPDGLAVRYTESSWKEIPRPVRLLLGAPAARRSGAKFLFLEERDLRPLSAEARHKALSSFEETLVLISYSPTDFQLVGDYGEETVLVLGEDGPLGVGSTEWFRRVAESEDANLGSAASPGDESMDLDEEDEI
jgi:hypothetical protein